MRRLRPGVIVAILALAAVWVAPGSGSHDPEHPFDGEWAITFSFGGTGMFSFALVEDDAAGLEQMNAIAAKNNSFAIPCQEPSDYYEGTWSSPTDSGMLAGCTTGDDRSIYAPYTNSGGVGFGVYLVASLGSDDTFSGQLYSDIDGDGLFSADSSFDGTRVCPPPARGLAGQACPEEEPPEEPPVQPPLPAGSPDGDPVKGECKGRAATITADPDNPPGFALIGTTSADVILGSPGMDRILALDGDDLVCGLGGDDEIFGAGGDDMLFGEDGADLLDGGVGNDTIEGGAGDDEILGGDDQDTLVGELGNDIVRGGNGSDRVMGGTYFYFPQPRSEDEDVGPDDDQLFGDSDGDSLHGGRGADVLRGGAGNDGFTGGTGNDKIYGEGGDDKLEGFAGNDLLDGAGGTDTVTYFDSPKPLSASLATGRVVGDGRDTMRGIEKLVASNFGDILIGSAQGDFINGWGGNDVIWGAKGSDHLVGYGGNDKVFGQGGFDRVDGGGGFDLCAGERRSNCDRVRRDTG